MAGRDYLGWGRDRNYRFAPWSRRTRDGKNKFYETPERLRRLKRKGYKLLSLPELLEAVTLAQERIDQGRRFANDFAQSDWWSTAMTSDAVVWHHSGEYKLVRDCPLIYNMDESAYNGAENGIQVDQHTYDSLEGLVLSKASLQSNGHCCDYYKHFGWRVSNGPNIVKNLMANPMWQHYTSGDCNLTEGFIKACSNHHFIWQNDGEGSDFFLSIAYHERDREKIVVYPLALGRHLVGGYLFRDAGELIGRKLPEE